MSDTAGAIPHSTTTAAGSTTDIANRMERLPLTKWQAQARMLIGTATFFDVSSL